MHWWQVERALRELLRQNNALRDQLQAANKPGERHMHVHNGSNVFCSDPLCQLRYLHNGVVRLGLREGIDSLGHRISSTLEAASIPPRLSSIGVGPAEPAERDVGEVEEKRVDNQSGESSQVQTQAQEPSGRRGRETVGASEMVQSARRLLHQSRLALHERRDRSANG